MADTVADPDQPVWLAVLSPQGGGHPAVCSTPCGGILLGQIMALKRGASHVLHVSDFPDDSWRASGAGYLLEDHAAPGPMGFRSTF